MKKIIAVAGLMTMAVLAGCGSSGSTSQSTPVSGIVADGYLQNALVFLDRNTNYQLDAGEPSARTDANGAYTLNVDPADIGRFPIVALALAHETIDMDTPGQTLASSYVLCTPAAGVSGTVSNFISPISTLLREKLEANPGMTPEEAMVQLRNQLGMPAGMNMLGDYVRGSGAGAFQAECRALHQAAQQMAGLMAEQEDLVMNGNGVHRERYRSMIGQLNQNLPQIIDNVNHSLGMTSDFMVTMRTRMQTMLGGIMTNATFGNYSAMFQNMTSQRYFWNYTGGQMHPRSRMM